MKHVRNFESFKNNRNVVTESQQNYYYKKGKASRKSIFEMELLSEGYSNEFIQSINESYSLNRMDNRIIDCLYEYLTTGKETGLELLTEEIGGMKLPSIGDMYKKVADVIDKGIDIGKSAIKSFGDFLKNIGNIVKNLFAKIKCIATNLASTAASSLSPKPWCPASRSPALGTPRRQRTPPCPSPCASSTQHRTARQSWQQASRQ